MIALYACTLWLCAPLPLVAGLPSVAVCEARARALAVPEIIYRCLEEL